MRDYEINSDLKQSKFESLKFVQGDTGSKIIVNLFEDSQTVNLSNCTVLAKYKRSDGYTDNKEATITDNVITVEVDETMTAIVGTLKLIFEITYETTKKVSTFMLLADVAEGIGSKSTTGGGTGDVVVDVDLSNYYTKSEVNSLLNNIANEFTTEQEDNNFILKYGDKIIATIPINGTVVNYGSIVVSCNEILEINEGEILDIEVYLSSKPTNNQSIVITTSNSNITTSVSELTFTPNNYATSQIVTLTAVQDTSSFEDKSCLVTFASENVENVNITVTVKNTDVQQDYVTDGLSLYYDFTETPAVPTTVYDKVNNLSIYNSGYTVENYTKNGVYLTNGGGANAFKFGSQSVDAYNYQTMTEFTAFLNKIKEGNGLTLEYFGQYIPWNLINAYNTGLEISSSNSTSGGYLTDNPSLGSAKINYVNTSNESTSVSLAQINTVIKDGSEINAYSTDNKADTYIHLVITADENGKLIWYLNGNPMKNTATATDFSSWDYDNMFKASYCMLLRAGAEDTNRLIYPVTSLKVYNRALTQEEIKTNLEYEVSRTDFINSANVTP